MPKRQSIKKHESTEVQGEDSYVVVKKTTLDEGNALRKIARRLERKIAAAKRAVERAASEDERTQAENDLETLEDERMAMQNKLLAEKIVEWNWVDDDGEPLPLPRNDPRVVGKLTTEEVAFIGDKIRGDVAEKKD